jgi:transposase
MAFREVSVVEVREVLRLWLRGGGYRPIAVLAGVDRKTARRYVEAAIEAGVVRDGNEDQLSDELIGVVCEAVRPARRHGHGSAWETIATHHELIEGWLDEDLTVVKVHVLLARRGVRVPYRTLHRYAVARCGFGRRQPTVRVNDGEPGGELQVDFGRMGLICDPATGKRRVCWALIFTACYSRHCFVWLTHRQNTVAVIAGFEAAWGFFGGVFRVVIPDNMATIVTKADAVEPRLSDAFVEYAQSRGFVIDPARVRHPRDKPRVERTVSYVRNNFFAGEDFADLADAQARVETWCAEVAGLRVHGTTQRRPVEVFTLEETPRLGPSPERPYDVPIYAKAKVHRDHHIEVGRALYSVPGDLIGQTVDVRADVALVRVFSRGQLVKVHPRQAPGRRSTDAGDLPAEKTAYAMRDLDQLRRVAAGHGPSVGAYATAVLDTPLPWTRMRQVYRLLGLVRRYGAERVEAACGRALEAEAVDVGLISRMLERATERTETLPPRPANVVAGRFARDASEFALGQATLNLSNCPHPDTRDRAQRASTGHTEPAFLDVRADRATGATR